MPAEVRRFASQQRIDISVAVQEVVLTILLRRIATSNVSNRLAFRRGMAPRISPRLVRMAAPSGKFSEALQAPS